MTSPLEEVRAALPVWAAFANLFAWSAASFLIVAACTAAGTAIALRPLLRMRRSGCATELSWVEQARLAYPARRAFGFGLFVAAAVLAAAAAALSPTVSAVPRLAVWLGMVASGTAARLLVGRRLRGALFGRRLSWAETLRDFVTFTVVARGILILLGLIVLSLTAADGRAAAWTVLGAGAVAVVLFVLCGGLPLLRLLGLARPAGQRLRGVVERAALRLNMEAPAGFEVTCSSAYAFALVDSRQVAFTTTAWSPPACSHRIRVPPGPVAAASGWRCCLRWRRPLRWAGRCF